MGDWIVVGILLIIIGAAIRFIWKEKKKGRRCIGCPASGCCSGNCCSIEKKKVDKREEKD